MEETLRTAGAEENKIEGALKLKVLRRIFLVINILAVIPILVIACFNVPSADDFSMAFEVHEAYMNTGNVFAAIFKALYMGYWYYMNWTGYFFSDAVTALSPSVFGEQFYFLGTFIILGIFTLGLWYFMRQLLYRILRIGDNLTGCITSITYFMLLQNMPKESRCESFFWYSGAVNYMFMFGLGLLWLGLILKSVMSEEDKKRNTVLLSVFGFFLGGANYMTGLSLAILSACIIIVSAIYAICQRLPKDRVQELKKIALVDVSLRLSVLRRAVIPALFMILGFVVAVIAPGNKVRSGGFAFSPVKAVMISLYYTLKNMFGEWITWPVLFLMFLLIIFIRKGIKKARRHCRFDHPLLFSLFAFLLSAANITPPVYATGNIEAGRIVGIYYMQTMLLLILMIGYLCGFIHNIVKKNSQSEKAKDDGRMGPMEMLYEGYLGESASKAVIGLSIVFIAGALMSAKVDPHFFTASSAVSDVVSGKAAVYRDEFDKRLDIYKDDNVKDAELSAFSEKPSLLFFSDITEDKKDWLNKAVAEYYHKDSVILKTAE